MDYGIYLQQMNSEWDADEFETDVHIHGRKVRSNASFSFLSTPSTVNLSCSLLTYLYQASPKMLTWNPL
jgi:hypothetical protein